MWVVVLRSVAEEIESGIESMLPLRVPQSTIQREQGYSEAALPYIAEYEAYRY